MSQNPTQLFKILNKLPRFGVGRKVTRDVWETTETKRKPTLNYWTIKKVVPHSVSWQQHVAVLFSVFIRRGLLPSRRTGPKLIYSFVQFHQLQSDCSISSGIDHTHLTLPRVNFAHAGLTERRGQHKLLANTHF